MSVLDVIFEVSAVEKRCTIIAKWDWALHRKSLVVSPDQVVNEAPLVSRLN